MAREWKMSSLNGFMNDTPDFVYSIAFDNNSIYQARFRSGNTYFVFAVILNGKPYGREILICCRVYAQKVAADGTLDGVALNFILTRKTKNDL